MKRTTAVAFSLVLFCALLFSYNPPTDTAGPITVQIQTPAAGAYGSGGLLRFTQPDVPFSVPVWIQNRGAALVTGTLRLAVIDRWRAEPSGPVPFSIGPGGRKQIEFTVSFPKGTFNAHYPIHAYAEFEFQGQRLIAHPVMILTVEQPNPPRAPVPVEFKPVPVPEKGAFGLWRLPVHREEVVALAEDTQAGTTGQETYASSPVVQFGFRARRGETREGIRVALGARPPSLRENVNRVRVEYPLELPKSQSLRLIFAGAVSDSLSSDGAVFRVRAQAFDATPGQTGETLVERNMTSTSWQEMEADLGRYAGRRIRLQLETSATKTGEAFWAETTITGGALPSPPAFPPTPGQKYRVLGTAGGYEVRLWPGNRGILDSPIGFATGEKQLLFRGFHARVAGDQLDEQRSTSEFLEAKEEQAAGRYRVRHRFRNWAGWFDLMTELWVEKDGLQARFWLENTPVARPWLAVYLEEIAAGEWSDRAVRVYGGPGNVIQDPQAFRLGFDGHNLATSYVGFDFANGMSMVQGVDVVSDRLEVDPQTRTYTLKTPHAQTVTLLPASNVWSAVRNWRDRMGWRASGGVKRLGSRFVFDLWSGRYGESAKALEKAFRYGLTDSVVIWHNSQRWGYDYRLFDINPPNPEYGTLDEFRGLVEVCKKNSVLFAPHDNYIDFYPDAEGFSYNHIAFLPNGEPRRAWFNFGRGAQSYRVRADRTPSFVERNLNLMRDSFTPTAYFIDVWSSISPYDYWTSDGQFIERSVTRTAWGEAFDWIREFLGDNAPQISEAGHDQLIGWLDGAQANHLRVDAEGRFFTWKIKCADAERIPWIDAAYHDRFVLHGAGYPGRYEGGLDSKTHGVYSDDYMATEMLTGRPAMVSEAFSRDVVRKYWLLHDVMEALALRKIDSVEFVDGDIHRQHVRWDSGAEVWVNRGNKEWKAGEHLLPPYGFYARAGVEAAIETVGGKTVEWSRSPAAVYGNARGDVAALGAIEASSGVRITRDKTGLLVMALPESAAFQLRLQTSSLPWQGADPRQAEALDESGNVIGTLPLRRDGDKVVLDYGAGVFAYRLK